jgi:thiol-disulfide isomerase/thioredoxin
MGIFEGMRFVKNQIDFMNSILQTLILAYFLISSNDISAQSINAIKVDDLLSRVENGGDTTFVINFWATWCAPCVRELPQFEALNSDTSFTKLKVLLVSLDFKRDYDTRLSAFIEKRGLKSEILFLNESDANVWVPKINHDWSGVIPATWVVNRQKGISDFKSSELEEDGLKTWIQHLTQ